MKIRKSVLTLVLAVAIIASFSAGAIASSTQRNVTAVLDYGATVKVNGVQMDFLDANGNRIYLINYDGTTYLPVRAIGEQLLGMQVGWDSASHTVLLDNNTKAVNLIDEIGAYYIDGHQPGANNTGYRYVEEHKTADGETENISGETAANWVRFFFSSDGASNRAPIGFKTHASYNLGGKYQSVTFKYYSTKDVSLRVLADGAVQKEIQVKGSQVAQEVTVPLFSAQELSFEAEKTTAKEDCNLYIYNVTVKPAD